MKTGFYLHLILKIVYYGKSKRDTVPHRKKVYWCKKVSTRLKQQQYTELWVYTNGVVILLLIPYNLVK